MSNDLLDELMRAATAADGQPPFSDQSLVDARTGARRMMTVSLPGADTNTGTSTSTGTGTSDPSAQGAALVTTTSEPAEAKPADAEPHEAELVVHPVARRQGLGERLLSEVVNSVTGTLLVWAHGDHPAAGILAERHGFTAVRTLLQLRAEVGEREATPHPEFTVQTFRSGVDDDAWLALNAQAFAEHPEQGRLTQRDLDARMAEPWFCVDDFLLLWAGDDLAGFCWLKVDGPIGEFYVVGVDPARQGAGIGRVLVEAGLARLAERGTPTASLYVEADNEPAVRLYRSYGFTDHTIDVQYRRP